MCEIGILCNALYIFWDHTKLPPTIYSHFRPITVTLPLLELVVRMLLHSEGFIEVGSIAIAAVESIGECENLFTTLKMTAMQSLHC